MANIPMYGATGDLFNRLGSLAYMIQQAYAYQQGVLTNLTSTSAGAVAQFNAESDIQAQLGSQYVTQANVPGDPIGNLMQQVAQSTANRMVFRSNPQLGQTITQANIVASIQEIIRQMKVQGATILRMTVGGTLTNPFSAFNTNVGNGTVTISLIRPVDGNPLENAFAEQLTALCSQDSYVGGAIAGNEGFTIYGEGSEPDVFAYDWPLGSNASATFNAISGNGNNSLGNLLYNSGFATWAAGAPSNWTINNGGGLLSQENSLTLLPSSTSALKITGDGSTLLSMQQPFDNASAGTPAALTPLTQYSLNIWMRRDGTAPSAGELTFSLIDGNNNVILDEAGNPCTTTVNLTTLTTSYAAYNVSFRTPQVLPFTVGTQTQTQSLLISMPAGNALSNGRAVYVDTMALGPMAQLYASGPFLAVFSGGTNFAQGDYCQLNVTNSRGAGGTLSTFQTVCFQMFYPYFLQNEFILPSAASPNVSDALITG
jgi:hypothetical protein